MSFGSGGGGYGLWFDSSLLIGTSSKCNTYNTECLASSEQFKVVAMEAWTLPPVRKTSTTFTRI